MSEQDILREIAKIAADANKSVLKITGVLADHDLVMNDDLSDLVYQLGYIEGLSLSCVSEEKE